MNKSKIGSDMTAMLQIDKITAIFALEMFWQLHDKTD
jgi:hypothetical protein